MSGIQYWTMKNGSKISVDDMDIDHLKNVLKMIIKNNQSVQKSCPHNATQASDYECDATEVDIY